ncbi:class I adenylate-forming enzyme family protein [Ideonella sp. DXS22W]|uniref:Class I adenylate-forming enzyme family protein n=1 Tax=Pseudaquabacterium inlustre TaxID=2984192 RepID=A0ABU9CHQ1_9BURK
MATTENGADLRAAPWADTPVPAMRHEALHGDRLVRCFIDRPPSVWAMFAASLARAPQAEALVAGDRRWTYAQLDADVTRLAAGFAAHGLQRGERVVMFIDNQPEFVTVWLALQRLGAITVPVGVREQRPGLSYIARQCGAAAIVADAGLVDRLPEAAGTPALRLRISVGEAPGCTPLAALQAGSDAPPPPADVAETDVAVILYTSGTTGQPKGATITHLNIAHSVLHYQVCMRLQADDRSALAVPASHVTGLIAIVAAMLHVGGAIVVVPAFKAESFIALLQAERITHTLMVPAMYNLCLLQPGFAEARLDAWRVGGYGGAPMPVATIDALAERLPGLTLLNCYGATETTSPTTMIPWGRTRAHADSVGVALPAADVKVMDDDGRELPPGETGELWIGGPMVVPGYWDRPEATASSFTAGYWHSGDLGSVDAEGYVRVFDRKKDMLNRGGFKIYSVEVENVLMGWPGMVEAAIVGKPCPVLGERVHAFVHVSPGHAAGDEHTAALRAFCAERLADYKVPEGITWSEVPLPRNANGKLMKRLLREGL